MLIALSALNDNYIWLYGRENLPILVVDPTKAPPVLHYLADNQLTLEGILLTHYHDDHTGGVADLLQHFPHTPVYGSPEVAMKGATHIIHEGVFSTPNYRLQAIPTGGHTKQHLSFLVDGYLFCGDSLFSAGCGRVFTQDFDAMYATLQRLKQLPDETLVCPAHEYTLSNLKFAQQITPKDGYLQEYTAKMTMLRAENKPTVPTTMAIEKRINPFLQAKTLKEFKQLRQQKDHFLG